MVVAGWVYFDQLDQDLELKFELQDLELEFDLQGLEPDFDLWEPELGFELWNPEPDSVLWDPVLDCGTLHSIHKLILSIWISGIRGIWSIHPNLNISEHFPYLKCANFPYMYIKLYPSSLQVNSTQQLLLK